MPDIGQQLSSLDFETLIGSPLTAMVEAQAKAAMTAVNFISQVGFKPAIDGGDDGPDQPRVPEVVTFRYSREVQVAGEEEPQQRNFELTVPLLAMVNVPYLRIESAELDFNAKITSVTYDEEHIARRFDGEAAARAGWLFGRARLKAKYTSIRNSVSTERTSRQYDMKVSVRAVGDEMPAGTDRLLAILESSIEERQQG